MKDHREICKCGHAKDTHFEKCATCLALSCACKRYRDPSEPDGVDELGPRPNHAPWCRCLGYKVHGPPAPHPAEKSDERDTDPIITPAFPYRGPWP